MAQTQDATVTGTVEAVNERGVKINGAWLNFSKFASVTPPEVGQEVVVTVRGDRWVQGLRVAGMSMEEIAGGAEPDFGEAAPADDDDPGTWGYGSSKGSAAPRPVRSGAPARPAEPVSTPPARNGRATLRAAALAAAAHFHSAKPESSEDDLYGTATRLLAWLEDAD
jgi:hypothetical protein